jgi:hypothetical protein
MKHKLAAYITEQDLDYLEEILKRNSYAECAAIKGIGLETFKYRAIKAAVYLMKRSNFPEYEIDRSVSKYVYIKERNVLFANLIRKYREFLEDPSRAVNDPMLIAITISEFREMLRETIWQAMTDFEPKAKKKIQFRRKLDYLNRNKKEKG